MKFVRLAIVAFAFYTTDCIAADTVRVCSYNVLNYSLSNDDGRTPMYAAIMNEIRPDVLMCTEVVDATMGPRFVTDVLTHAPFAATPFIDGFDTDGQLFYNQLKFDFIDQQRISTALRDIAEFTLVTKHNDGLPEDTVVFYAMHLKASDGSQNETARMLEVQRFRASVSAQPYVVIGGDMNFYSTNESGYQHFLQPPTGRSFVDPLGTSWSRNNAQWTHIYTQCTRLSIASGCGGGVDGGMDDRFDYFFISPQLQPRFVSNSYIAYGNDGPARLNKSINDPPNTIVTAEIANALHCASDHLPIYMDIVLGDIQASVEVGSREAADGNRDAVRGRRQAAEGTTYYDLLGNHIQVNASQLPPGFYIAVSQDQAKLIIVN